ncbi:hypothetical protein BSL78_11215 [Apostichopus japonicus]|uniref:Uncharacterized protein n=1 Tax=Stichopus japonicus TaxID=307972 RepID=A0A2G8KV72_STIJA|nr:hypothetical protein BSL78_11215 [Apostichopus japonicus]
MENLSAQDCIQLLIIVQYVKCHVSRKKTKKQTIKISHNIFTQRRTCFCLSVWGLLCYISEDPEVEDDVSEIDVEGGWKTLIKEFQKTVADVMKTFQASISKLEKDLGKAVEFQAARIDTLELKMAAKEKECEDLSRKITRLEQTILSTNTEVNKQERRNKLPIVGIPSTEAEVCEDIVKTTVLPLFTDFPRYRSSGVIETDEAMRRYRHTF